MLERMNFMERERNIIAFDCGNSSFRIVLGRFNGKSIEREVIDQYSNNIIQAGEFFYWDILRIFDCFKNSLRKAAAQVDRIDSIGICTWGVDFALYDKSAIMLSNPLAYRNTIGAEQIAGLDDETREELFFETGILSDKINSIYMLKGMQDAMPNLYSITDKLLMVPDIINYMLTGIMRNEPSELSTTQMMDVRTRSISTTACKNMGVDPNLFCSISSHGEKIGMLRKEICQELGVQYDIPVISVPSHDTASAVLAIPAQEDDFAFISSGTWSLIGTELDEPLVTKEVMEASLTNELGALNTITLLKNSAGMFIHQRLRKDYELIVGRSADWDELNSLMEAYKGDVPLIDVNSDCFFNPLDMSKAIWDYLLNQGKVSGAPDWGIILASLYHSMAECYKETIEEIQRVCKKEFNNIYIVGGGSKNFILNQITADRSGKNVVACDTESTALGCIISQLKYFDHSMSIKDMRAVADASIQKKVYAPKQ